MDYKKALYKAAALCSQQERCVSEIRKKLVNWEVSDEETNKAIQFLIEEKYINEQRFAEFYVRDKFRFNGWGKIKIKYHLKQKEIANSDIENALAEINSSDYFSKLAELLQGKLKQIKNKDVWQTKAALARFGQSRGFEPHLIFQCIDEILNADN
ncbi:regulatory protein RecX [Carboxylicivirga caseinilyticus]|uniref:regulatory protein RecX n=1 Tax=Carboxylicivirga caseinilyticus TaxID=3417572 RepID=UPI003D34E397|nr:RecX family transcriptional regulator [Marinilabiliaceae bacterium A049]